MKCVLYKIKVKIFPRLQLYNSFNVHGCILIKNIENVEKIDEFKRYFNFNSVMSNTKE